MYHSSVYTNKELRRLLRKAGIPLESFILANIKGKPARTKNKVVFEGNKVTIFGPDFIAKGFIKT